MARAGRGDRALIVAGQVVLLHASPRVAPGLLSAEAWQALARSRARLARSVDEPLAAAVTGAGHEVRALGEQASTEAVVTALVSAASEGDVVWLCAEGEAEDLSRACRDAGVPARSLAGSWDLPGAHLIDAVAVMDRLRSPGGCPWDAEQTHETLAPYAVEEAGEVAEAIAGLADGSHRYEDLKEELGDLLLQVLFNARVAAEGSHPAAHGSTEADHPFAVDDVADTLVAKLVRRHPHVFGGSSASTPEEVEAQWEQIKARERTDRARRRRAANDGPARASTNE